MLSNKLLVALLISACVVPAHAADMGWYGFGSFGRTTVNIDTGQTVQTFQAAGFTNVTVSADENGIGYKFGVGYMFNQNFGIEGGWVDLGKAQESVSAPGGPIPVVAIADVKASGPFLAGIASFPINNQFSGFAKLGFIDATVKSNPTIIPTIKATSTTFVGGGVNWTDSQSASKWKTMFGVGVQYDWNQQTGIRAEYEKFQKLGDKDTTGEADVDMISIGAVFRFK